MSAATPASLSPVSSLAGVLFAAVPLILVFALWTASLFSESAANLVYKLHLLRLGVANLAFSKDKKWKKPAEDAARVSKDGKKKRVIFVRHGESAWNVVFNKGFGPSFPKRLGEALNAEASMATTLDSVFVDSPLSELGCDQGLELQQYIETAGEDGDGAILKALPGAPTSILASSNLRRAISTGTIGFWQRLRRTQEKIHILSSLQEITFNIDGVSLAKPKSAPVLSEAEVRALGLKRSAFQPERYFDASQNAGDKPIRGSGLARLKEFAEWAAGREEDVVIAAGHSLYFRFFFQTFLPSTSTHIAKKDKMANGCVVAFDLYEGVDSKTKQKYWSVDEASIRVLHQDFESRHKAAHAKSA